MRVCGIIAEYDPFHKGHLYQMDAARAAAQADFVVCVLSTAFLQRGMPSLFSTHERARMALENGADAVFALPIAFSPMEAERFAYGGVSILNALGTVTHLSFGCETDDLTALSKAAACLQGEPPEYQALLKENLSSGQSHADAQGRALAAFTGLSADLFKSPNNVLAICYLRALKALNSDITPVPVKRLGDYHGQTSEGFPSASILRERFLKGGLSAIEHDIPKATRDIIETAVLCPSDALDQAMLYRLSEMNADDLRAISAVSEGLENRFLHSRNEATSREALLSAVKTKRYPYARLSRVLAHALLHLNKADLPQSPAYARLLGFRKTALPFLHECAKKSELPLISKPADYSGLLTADAYAERVWALGAQTPYTFYQDSPIII